MTICDELFESFVRCKTKCYLLYKGFENLPHEYSKWQNILINEYKKKGLLKLKLKYKKSEY